MSAENPKHKNVFEALPHAQSEMQRIVKDSVNPHYKSTYADLAAVLEAVMPALNKHGLCLWHYIRHTPEHMFLVTVISHMGEAVTQITCEVPLILSKNDMQGLKSAITYAKRIGVESLCGVAPEDDDGNAAAAAAPPKQDRPPQPPEKYTGTDQQRQVLRNIFRQEGVEDDERMIKIAERCQGKPMTELREFVKKEAHGGRSPS